jgi:hypothetical protein
MDHLCPPHIRDLWPNDRAKALVEVGRWIDTITLEANDRVWLPDIGWLPGHIMRALQSIKCPPAGQKRDEPGDKRGADAAAPRCAKHAVVPS